MSVKNNEQIAKELENQSKGLKVVPGVDNTPAGYAGSVQSPYSGEIKSASRIAAEKAEESEKLKGPDGDETGLAHQKDIEELKQNGIPGGFTVVPNPEEEPTEALTKIKIDGVVYSVEGGSELDELMKEEF